MPNVQTVTGPIPADAMGFTLSHEHVIVRWPPLHLDYDYEFARASVLTTAIAQLRSAYRAGVRTMFEMTPIDLGRHAAMLREASAASGVQLIAATGFYWQLPMAFRYRRTDEIAAFMTREIVEEIGHTGVRAGVIKCASEEQIDRMNERVLRAAAICQAETGVPIGTHSSPQHGTGLQQARILVDAGADPSRVVIGHCDEAPDLSYLEAILSTGCSIGIDRFGLNAARSTEDRVELIERLLDRGYASRIVLSHDAASYIETVTQELRDRFPDWHYEFLPTTVLPMLRERGIPAEAIRMLVEDNPRRLFGSP